ncbi:MAG: hypothetical protein GC201_14195 [Alphaproteobacteria bacterium]|nr:hypothetical protein [Alphaproteobacteria bacterium]
MTETALADPPTIVPFLKFDERGAPFLAGSRCADCGTVYAGERMACSKCFSRKPFEAVRLPTTGELYTFSIVYRSYPGIQVPFVSATVDLDGACALKGTLVDVAPDTDHVKMGMKVEVVFRELEHKDKQGRPYVSYFFVPAKG